MLFRSREYRNLKFYERRINSLFAGASKQLELLNPKLIITLGEFPTRNLLDFKFDHFSEVVGHIYEVKGYKVLPIHHSSPISPKSYKGNVPIFEMLKLEMEKEKYE